MYKDKKFLAIIPARGGSKGLPKKNIKVMNGKPLIAWTIENAKKCPYIDEIYVSTDSQEIADVCENFGIKVPELRPDYLASDTSTSADVVIHVLDTLEKQGKKFDYFMLLEPTSPLRKKDIEKLTHFVINNLELLLKLANGEIDFTTEFLPNVKY